MGTRSLTFVYEKYGDVQKPVVNMYRQFDGYPTGHGAELAEFLSSGRLINGLDGIGKELQFNGMGCLAAQMVAHFKQSPGGFYIHPTDVTDCGQDYEYHVFAETGLLSGGLFRIEVYNCGCNFFGMSGDSRELEFKGNLKEFTKFCSDDLPDEQENIFDGSTVGQDWLKSCLRDGVVTVNFVKSDGTERTMKCTLSKEIVPPVVSENVKKVRAISSDVLPVYDVDAQGWRSFRWDSIKSVEIK